MFANLYYTFLLRLVQATTDASLTLVIGVLIAGVFRQMVGAAGTRRLFGSGVNGSIRGWTAGMLLPVCSLGVIPVSRELRRAGVPGGTVLAFVLTGPLLNPISFLYGLTLGEPKVILTFAAITLLKTAFVAHLWDHGFGGSADAELAIERARLADAEVLPTAGIRRVLSVVVTAARELTGRDIVYYLIGLLGNAILSALIPCGALQKSMFHHDPRAPLRMLFLSIPAYMSPLSGMVKIGSMFEHGNSIGAAFILLVLGIGMCAGTLAWLLNDFGRRIVPWFAVYASIVLGLAYAVEYPLWDSRKVEADHTHAFDEFSSPFYADRETTPALMRARVLSKLPEYFQLQQKLSLSCLGGLLLAGVTLRVVDRPGRLDGWLAAAKTAGTRGGGWDVPVSGVVVGGTTIAGLIAFSVIGAYVYFPDRQHCLERMRYLSAEATDTTRLGRVDESIRYMEQWDLAARQLQVGVFIREFHVTAEQSRSVDALRESIEHIRDELRTGKLDDARRDLTFSIFHGDYQKCRDAYATRPGRTGGR